MKDETVSKSAGVSRRDFIKTSVATAGSAAVAAGLSERLLADERKKGGKSKVIKVVSSKVLAKQEVTAAVDQDVVRQMIEKGMEKLTGKPSLAEALGEFVTTDDVVGLKINCLGREHLSTHPQIPEVVSEALMELGVPADRIFVFDRYTDQLKQAGYKLAEKQGEVQCVGFDNDMDEKAKYTTPDGKSTGNWPKIVTGKLTKIINLPVMKNHSIAGVTLALKNIAFGLIHPTRNTFHGDMCMPFIVDVWQQKYIQEKVVLHILDGILTGFDGGPAKCTNDKKEVNNALYFGVDPVALDYVVRGDLNNVRKKRKMPQVGLDMTKHIEEAARAGIGTANPKKIVLEKVKV